MPRFRTLDDLPADLAGRVVLTRVDLNVPMRNGAVADRTRIERLASTISDLTARGARVALLSHFGRPKGVRNLEWSLRPIADALNYALGLGSVRFFRFGLRRSFSSRASTPPSSTAAL